MSIFNILTLFGGLAVFLYGMNVMGEGLTKASGGKLESILEKLTSNKLLAILVGAGVTAVIQSSSATTVVIVGFVNSGLMKLSQTVPIIMGANIGTTITAWLLSMTSISSDNVFVQFLKPTAFGAVLAAIGIVYVAFLKNEKRRNIGEIFVGFYLLIIGMNLMSESVSPLANDPNFTSILTMFSNPILGVLAGALLTAVIQSSSASIGILQALCVTGAVNYSSAIPILMGQNIGTCITAILSSIGASKNAKRTAAVHLFFNSISTVIFMVVFYPINAFVHFDILSQPATALGIAIFHTCFNVGATIILAPFSKWLEKLAIFVIRDNEKIETVSEFQPLDDRFLSSPGLALEQTMQVTGKMCELCKEGLLDAIDLLQGHYDEKTEQHIEALEAKVDLYEDKLGTYLVKLSKFELSEEDSQRISILLHSIGDIERMSDHSLDIAKAAKEMDEKGLSFSDAAKKELDVFANAIRDIVTRTSKVFEKEDIELAKTVEPLEQVIDDLDSTIKRNHVNRLKNGECSIELGFILSDILNCYERVADHCSNIAVCQIEVRKGEYDTHEYLNGVKGNSEEFEREREEFAREYSLV